MMKKRGSLSNFLIPAAMVLFLSLVYKYQDTDFFQSSMAFLFNPDPGLALPLFWQKYRMLFQGGLILVLFFYYKSVWLSYKYFVRLYRDALERKISPSISVVDACYLYRQNKTLCLVAWVVELCSRRVLTLHYQKGVNPWSIGRGTSRIMQLPEQQLLEILFQHQEPIRLQAVVSSPDPDFQEVADQLYKSIKVKNSTTIRPGQSSLPAWIVLLALIAEIPFYVASQPGEIPLTFVVTLFSAGIFTLPVYMFCYDFPAFFNNSKILAYIKLAVAFLFSVLGHWILFVDFVSSGPYLSTALYPDLVAALIVLVHMVPPTPEDPGQMARIVGYVKHLAADGYRVREEDLPWTLGMGLYVDIIVPTFHYDGMVLPEWLHSEKDNDVQSMMKLMHQTLTQEVHTALYGEMDGFKNNLGSGAGNPGWRY